MAKVKDEKYPDSKVKGPAVKKRGKVDVSDMLVKGEEIVVEAVIHNGIYWRTAVVFIFAIIMALLVFELGLLLLVVSILMFVHVTAKKSLLMLIVTNKRVLLRYGILQVDVVDMRFSKIESIELERMMPGYLMGYANVVLMGTGNRYSVIPFVANAVELRRAYNKITLADDDLDDDDE
jgi:hypothetical protein